MNIRSRGADMFKFNKTLTEKFAAETPKAIKEQSISTETPKTEVSPDKNHERELNDLRWMLLDSMFLVTRGMK